MDNIGAIKKNIIKYVDAPLLPFFLVLIRSLEE